MVQDFRVLYIKLPLYVRVASERKCVLSDNYFAWVTTDNSAFYAMKKARQAYNNRICQGAPCDWDSNLDLLNSTLAVSPPHNTLDPNVQNTGDSVYDPHPRILGSAGGSVLYRMKEGVERFLITDINNPAGSALSQSSVPVYMDSFASALSVSMGRQRLARVASFNHLPGGANVLFMDGHVEFLKFPGRHPITKYIAMKSVLAQADAGVGSGFINDYPGP